MIPGMKFSRRRRSTPLVRQKIVKSGGDFTAGTTSVPASGWSSDTTYPGTVYGTTGLRVRGTGNGVLKASVFLNYSCAGTMYIYRNGVQVVEGQVTTAMQTKVLYLSGMAKDGDYAEIWLKSDQTWNPVKAGMGSFMELIPV